MLISSCSNDEPTIDDNNKTDNLENKEQEEKPTILDAPVEIKFTSVDKVVAANMQGFDAAYIEALMKQEEGTTICSPLSAGLLLSLVAEGENDDVAAEIAQVLGHKDMSETKHFCTKVLKGFPAADESTTVDFANSVWYKNCYDINPVYAKTIEESYIAETFKRELSSVATMNEINSWVENKTKGWIKEILERPTDGDVIHINTVYFKGLWANPFDKNETKPMVFNGQKGKTDVQMMYNGGMQHYAKNEDFAAVKMQFGKGAFEAVIVLPNDGKSVEEILTKEEIEKIKAVRYEDEAVDYFLPKFKLDELDKIFLNDILKTLGVNKFYESHINPQLFTKPVSIPLIKTYQKATMEFTETGAEGAAVTWNMEATAPGPDYEPVKPEIKFDRPFAFFINHVETGACLFAGRITDL